MKTQNPSPTIERQGARAEPYTYMYPRVIGGVCEYCGIMDSKQSSTIQYQLCPHFKAIGALRCSYCPENANPEDVVYHAELKVHVHPDNPNKLVVVCDSYNCTQKHIDRFKRSV